MLSWVQLVSLPFLVCMGPVFSSGYGINKFSNCSYAAFWSTYASANCLRKEKKPVMKFKFKSCGNGVVEDGEQCDCGSWQACRADPCCVEGCMLQERFAIFYVPVFNFSFEIVIDFQESIHIQAVLESNLLARMYEDFLQVLQYLQLNPEKEGYAHLGFPVAFPTWTLLREEARLVMFCEVKKDIHGTWTFSIQYCGQLLHTSLTQSNAFAS
ncbi:disintegrin and metalloproteinase domain-containing protein 25 [Cricetulus griseus]|uniref:Disintegrin and metalloproteinase domain-containing protein 25 n=1 Tax=Cricetulus griseus TaxID=10029 RepID=A0A061IK56_CRIGR|nr:disintegrin and metalloproteinase domain-containing protein 25 [Cricetulus griseus]